jgi:hypothetical protein
MIGQNNSSSDKKNGKICCNPQKFPASYSVRVYSTAINWWLNASPDTMVVLENATLPMGESPDRD